MTPGLKHILARLAVSFLTLAADAHDAEVPGGPDSGDAILKLCKEAWSWIAGACGAAGGYVAEHDLIFWLSVLLLLLTALDRCYEILLKCRRFRKMSAED